MNEAASNENGRMAIDFPLWRLLGHTSYLVGRARERELAELALTPEQAYVLDILHAAGGTTTINRIVAMTQRKHNSISALVDRMARQGLVKKSRTRRDRRVFNIRSTPKGEALLAKVPRESLRQAFACLGAAEKRQLEHLLRLVMEHAYRLEGMESPYEAPAEFADD